MADQAEVDAAELDARLTLLKQIKESANGTTSANLLERLSYAFALTTSAAYGKPPGGPTHVNVTK
jgi:hypothetical protein